MGGMMALRSRCRAAAPAARASRLRDDFRRHCRRLPQAMIGVAARAEAPIFISAGAMPPPACFGASLRCFFHILALMQQR